MRLSERLARLEALELPEIAHHLDVVDRLLTQAEDKFLRDTPTWAGGTIWPIAPSSDATDARRVKFTPEDPEAR